MPPDGLAAPVSCKLRRMRGRAVGCVAVVGFLTCVACSVISRRELHFRSVASDKKHAIEVVWHLFFPDGLLEVYVESDRKRELVGTGNVDWAPGVGEVAWDETGGVVAMFVCNQLSRTGHVLLAYDYVRAKPVASERYETQLIDVAKRRYGSLLIAEGLEKGGEIGECVCARQDSLSARFRESVSAQKILSSEP